MVDATLDARVDAPTEPTDGPVDARVDGGPLRCLGEPFPLPSEPPCSEAQAACFRACADRACVFDCMDEALVDCWDCVFAAELNCKIEQCPEELNAWRCCREEHCSGLSMCPVCEPELEATRVCAADAYLPHCMAALEACFP